MTPTFCAFHQHWTDGACAAGRRSINRHDLTQRIADIDFMLDDDEGAQSRGFNANKALQAERAQLLVLRDVV